MPLPFRNQLTRLGVFTARPAAFLVFLAYGLAWVVFDRASLDWHGLATLATWGMTLVIQRSEHRDTQAIQAKLDALIKAQAGASDALTGIDRQEPEEIEAARDTAAQSTRAQDTGGAAP